jgi:hypothetical protein
MKGMVRKKRMKRKMRKMRMTRRDKTLRRWLMRQMR